MISQHDYTQLKVAGVEHLLAPFFSFSLFILILKLLFPIKSILQAISMLVNFTNPSIFMPQHHNPHLSQLQLFQQLTIPALVSFLPFFYSSILHVISFTLPLQLPFQPSFWPLPLPIPSLLFLMLTYSLCYLLHSPRLVRNHK